MVLLKSFLQTCPCSFLLLVVLAMPFWVASFDEHLVEDHGNEQLVVCIGVYVADRRTRERECSWFYRAAGGHVLANHHDIWEHSFPDIVADYVAQHHSNDHLVRCIGLHHCGDGCGCQYDL